MIVMSHSPESDHGEASRQNSPLRFDHGTFGALAATTPRHGFINLLGGSKVPVGRTEDEESDA